MERFLLPQPDFCNPSLDFYIAGLDSHVKVCTILIPLKVGSYQCIIFTDRLEFLSSKESLDSFGVPFSATVSLAADWSLKSQFNAAENMARDIGLLRSVFPHVFKASSNKE